MVCHVSGVGFSAEFPNSGRVCVGKVSGRIDEAPAVSVEYPKGVFAVESPGFRGDVPCHQRSPSCGPEFEDRFGLAEKNSVDGFGFTGGTG
jgi:hypothetical protein